MQDQAKIWKTLYKEFEIQASSTSTVKPNEILLDIANMMQDNLNTTTCSFIVICLDTLSSAIDYEYLSGM